MHCSTVKIPCTPCPSRNFYNPCDPCPSTNFYNPCDPCPKKSTCPPCPISKTQYFYVERSTSPDPDKKSLDRKRASSQPRNVKSGGSRKGFARNEKDAKSDSKILGNKAKTIKKNAAPGKNKESRNSKLDPETVKNKGNRNSKLDPESVNQLKQDLKTIKEQLTHLTQNRDEALNLTNVLEDRYTNLMEKSQQQEKEIFLLREKNRDLETQLNTRAIECPSKNCSVANTQTTGDGYDKQLTSLFKELMDTSKVIEESKNKVCRCIKEKSQEYQDITNSTKELSKVIKEKDAKYACLMKNYEQTKENERKLIELNNKLIKTVEELENNLHQTVMELEASRQDAAAATKKLQDEILEKTRIYTDEALRKSREIDELNAAVTELKSQFCQCGQVVQQYQKAMEKLKCAEMNCKSRTEELEMQKRKEKSLICEFVKMKELVDELRKCQNDNCANITRLDIMNQEKDSIIECQRGDLAAKDKKIDLLLKNEERLKQQLVELQEQVLTLKMAPPKRKCSEGCAANVAELQDLIAALYDEINKSLNKDEQIQLKNRQICGLKCTLTSKEKSLIYACNQLKILRDQFQMTLNEKRALAEQLQRLLEESQYGDSTDNYPDDFT